MSSVTYFFPFHRFILRDHKIVYTMLHVSHIFTTLFIIIYYVLLLVMLYYRVTNWENVHRVCVSAWHASFSTDFFGPPLPPYHLLAVYPDNVYNLVCVYLRLIYFETLYDGHRSVVTTSRVRVGPKYMLKACPNGIRRETILYTHIYNDYTLVCV